jgi:vitamin B12 transporter
MNRGPWPSGARWIAGILCGAIVAARVGAQVPGQLLVRVTDARTARPIGDARIELDGRGDLMRSRPDGSFVVRGLEPRDYVMHVRAFGFVGQDRDVTVANGRATTIEVALDPLPASLEAVVVRAARDSLPLNAMTFDRAAIEASGRRDLGELLQASPGVVITQAGGPGSASRASIRGSSAGEVLVLVDGVPINSPITGEADLSRVSLETVERVVVRSGAQSARYGGRALAGTIDITTRRASHEASALVRDGAWGERQLSVTIGNGMTGEAARMTGSMTGEYRTIAGDFPYDVPAVRGGGSARRINSDVTSRQLLGNLTFERDSMTLHARGAWSALERGLAGSIVQPSSTGRQGNSRSNAGIDGHLDRWGVTWLAAADVTRERSTFADPAPPFGTAYDDAVTATGVTGTTELATQRGPLRAAIGGEARGLGVSSTMLAASAPHWQQLLGGWSSVRLGREFGLARIDADLSARVDHGSLLGDAVVSPRGTVTLSRGVLAASASVGNGYSPPSLADQFFHEGVLVRANPALRPERTTGDVEARFGAHDVVVGPLRLSGEAAAFRANVDGMILWLPDFRFIWSPSNVGVRRSGWELTGRATAARARLDIQGTLNRAGVVYTGPVLDGQVAYRPRTTASITAGAGTRWGGGRVDISNRYVGSRRTVPGSALNSLAPYWLSDARWTTPVPLRHWLIDVGIGVDNLFDRPAAMLVDYPFPGRTWTLSLRARRTPLI